MDFAGIYGAPKWAEKPTPTATAEASGPPDVSPRPAHFWAAMVLLLVGVRIIYERAE